MKRCPEKCWCWFKDDMSQDCPWHEDIQSKQMTNHNQKGFLFTDRVGVGISSCARLHIADPCIGFEGFKVQKAESNPSPLKQCVKEKEND